MSNIRDYNDLEEDCCIGYRVPPVSGNGLGDISKNENLCSEKFDSGLESLQSGNCKSEREHSVAMPPTKHAVSLQTPAKQHVQDMTCQSVMDSGYDSQNVESAMENLSIGPAATQTCSLRHGIEKEDYALKIFTQDEDGDNQFMIAIIHLLEDVAIGMIHKAPSVDCLDMTNGYHQTAMHLAVLVKLPGVVNALLQAGASSSIVDHNGNTALHLACKGGDEKCISLLTHPLKQDVNALNFEGLSCLHIAAKNNHPRIIYYLTKKCGANINVKDGKSGRTPLHYAAENDNQRLVELLLNWEADIEAMTFDNSTPLRLAAGRRHQKVVMILMNFGADAEALSSFSSDDSDDCDDDEMDADDIKIDGLPI